MKKMMLVILMAVGLMANVATNEDTSFYKGERYECKSMTSDMQDVDIYFLPDGSAIILNRTYVFTFEEKVRLFVGDVKGGNTGIIGITNEDLTIKMSLGGNTFDFKCEEVKE